jgi:hypothetical protein
VPTLQLVGDQATNPKAVSVVADDRRPGDSATSMGDRLSSSKLATHLDVTTQAMLRLAGEATAHGMRVQAIRLDDVSRTDSPELAELQERVLEKLRQGDADSASAVLMNWPGVLIVTDLALRDDKVAKTVMHVSRNGVISFGGRSLTEVRDRIEEIVTRHPEIFAS